MSRVVTLTEVAQRAGVSLTTASKAINGRAKISPATRERVLAVARELDYAPNPLARGLHSGQSGTVGLVLVSADTYRFAVPLILGVEAELAEIDLSLILTDAHGDIGRVDELARTLARRRVDGLVVVGDNNAPTPTLGAHPALPVVYTHGPTVRPEDHAHAPDDRGGIALAVDHLVAAGRTRLAHVAGPAGTRAADERAAGFTVALARHGLTSAAPTTFGPWSQRRGRAAVAALLAAHPETDGIVCGSDQLATGALAAVEATGRRVPDDVAVTGYDNQPLLADESDPPLTSVDLDLEALGAATARRLDALLSGTSSGPPPAPGLHLQPARLVVRASTAVTYP